MWCLSFFFALLSLSLEALSYSITVEIDGLNNVGSNSRLDKGRQVVETVREIQNKCEPNAMPDFSKFAERLSELKCMEYIYELLQRQEKDNWHCSDVNDISIINGKKVEAAEYPHMGALGWKLKRSREPIFLCAATLISERFMLTAAHCVYSDRRDLASPEPYFVRLGSRFIKKSPAELPTNIPIEKLITYSKYESPMKYNDIALVKLVEDVKFSKFIMPACLPANEEFNTRHRFVVSGWGLDTDNAMPNYEILYTDVSILNNKICDKLLATYKSLNWRGMQPHEMCAIQRDYGTGVCTGDSGGPMQYLLFNTTSEGAIHRIISVASLGLTECSSQYIPGLYTRVSSFLSWIEYNVWSGEKNYSIK